MITKREFSVLWSGRTRSFVTLDKAIAAAKLMAAESDDTAEIYKGDLLGFITVWPDGRVEDPPPRWSAS